MSFLWDVYERVSAVIGPEGAVVAFAILVGATLWLALGSTRPSN
jgi:hypothetical protein